MERQIYEYKERVPVVYIIEYTDNTDSTEPRRYLDYTYFDKMEDVINHLESEGFVHDYDDFWENNLTHEVAEVFTLERKQGEI